MSINLFKSESHVIPAFIRMVADLGEGEAEVLSLACETEKPLVIIDDRMGRELAELQQFKVTGTVGILLRAKQRELIKAVSPYLEDLREEGFYLSKEVAERILKLAHE